MHASLVVITKIAGFRIDPRDLRPGYWRPTELKIRGFAVISSLFLSKITIVSEDTTKSFTAPRTSVDESRWYVLGAKNP